MSQVASICKKIWGRFFRDHPYDYLGRLLVKILPSSYTSQFYADVFIGGPSGWLANSILRGLKRQYYSKSDEEIRRMNRTLLWGSEPGILFHKHRKKLYMDEEESQKIFLKYKGRLVNHISTLLSKRSDYHTICEIGTGNGMLLDYMSKRYKNISKFIGVDLNREQVLENRERYKSTNLEFVHMEITDWIKTKCADRTIFVSTTTLMHFTLNELKELLELIISKFSKSAVALNEPTHPDILGDQPSKPGAVLAYFHNYNYLFTQLGYYIASKEIIPVDPEITLAKHDNIIIVATTNPVQK
jgi:hypothetical protein